MADEIKTWQVRIKDNRSPRRSYWNTNSNIKKLTDGERQKEQEVFISNFYNAINNVVDIGGLIDPGKYFSEGSIYFNIRSTEEIADKVKKFVNVDEVRLLRR